MVKYSWVLPFLLTGCVSFDVRVIDAPPPPEPKVDVPVRPQGHLSLLPYPKKPSLGGEVKDHNAIESILINHINALHRVNQVNIERVRRYGK